jgi:hypothetical protein
VAASKKPSGSAGAALGDIRLDRRARQGGGSASDVNPTTSRGSAIASILIAGSSSCGIRNNLASTQADDRSAEGVHSAPEGISIDTCDCLVIVYDYIVE